MEFNRLPLDIISRICDMSSLQDAVMLSATSKSMKQVATKVIGDKKAVMEKTFNQLVISHYFNLHKRKNGDIDTDESINQCIRIFIGDAEILAVTDDGILIPDNFTKTYHGNLIDELDVNYFYDMFAYFTNGEKSSIVFCKESEYCGEVISIIDSDSTPRGCEMDSMIDLCKAIDACL